MISKDVDSHIVVSISCITYNHAPYIRQCLDGFLMQKTNFAIEVLIHDDASTDGTTEIIKEYEAKYPDIIKPIYEEENQWVKGRRGSAVFNFPRAKGKYIALCEGDDYWTDPLKLQRQVDFLEENQDYVLTSHYYIQYFQELQRYGDILPSQLKGNIIYNLQDFISYKCWYTQPLTTVFRRSALNLEHYSKFNCSKDVTLFYLLLKEGKGLLMDDVMGCYRINKTGVWSSVGRQDRIIADLQCLKGIYDVEETDDSLSYIYNYLIRTGYLGISFFRRSLSLYISIISIMLKWNTIKALKVLIATSNFFRR